MNKAFRRSLLSLTTASAMAASAFAGDAAYLDVHVNYLNPEGTVILGIDDDLTDSKQRDRVEILVTLLDKDGEYASRSIGGKTLEEISLKRNGTSLSTDANVSAQEAGGIVLNSSSGAPLGGGENLKLFRAMEENKNITRFVLDYSDFISSSDLEDTIEVSGGGISKDVMVKFSATEAKGLVVRITKHSEMKNNSVLDSTMASTNATGLKKNDTDNYINENFSSIEITDDINLSFQSDSVPTGVAGGMVPVRVYASTIAPDLKAANLDNIGDQNSTTSGRFTLAPNLEGKTIVVQAMADYELDGNASTMLNSVELVMKNGIAVGEIQINQGLPGSTSLDGALNGVQPSAVFGKVPTNDGLGVVFVAYVKDDTEIANLKDIDVDKASTMVMIASNADTDAVIIRSKDPVGLKVGKIDATVTSMDDLWTSTSSKFHLMDINATLYSADRSGMTDTNITMTVVDDLGNPALMATDSVLQYRRWDNDVVDNDGDRFNAIKGINTGTALDFNGSAAANIATVVQLDVASKGDKNGSGKETLYVSYSSGSLSGMDPVELEFIQVETIKSKVSGNPILADLIDVNTSTKTESPAMPNSIILSGLEPLDGIGTERNSQGIYPEFKAKLKVVAIDGNTTKNDDGKESNSTMTLRLTIEDPEDSSELITKKYGMIISYESPNSYTRTLGYGKDSTQTAITTSPTTAASVDDFFEFNITGAAGIENNISLTITRTGVALASLKFGNFADKDIQKLKGNSVTINFKAFDSLKQEVYAEAYFETSNDNIIGEKSDDSMPAGSVLKFKFSGEVSEGDKVVLDFNSTGGTDGSYVFLESDGYDSENESNSTTAILGADKIVSVVLYDTNASNNKHDDSIGDRVIKYGLNKLTVNGIPVIYKTQQDDEDTKEIYEVALADLFYNKLSISALDVKGAAKVRFNFDNVGSTDEITFDQDTADGSEDEKQISLPVAIASEIKDLGATSNPVTLDEEVETGLYYGFFGADAMVSVRDKYNHYVDMEETDMEENFDIECSSGLECKAEAKSGTNIDSYLLFKPEAAGTTQTITFKVKGNEKVMNTISFSNIRKASQNTKIEITRDIGHATFNVVNSEVVVKIIGDGGKNQEDTKLTVVSSNKEAKVKLVPLAVNNKFFTNALNTAGEYETTVNDRGSYFFVTSDKPGVVTISASATISKDDSDTKEEVTLSGSSTVNFVEVDLDNPDVSKGSITAIPSGLSIKINDANLDVDKTRVLIKGVDDDGKKPVEYKGNNTYVVSGLPIGTYQILIKAHDLAGNYAEADYVRDITIGDTAGTPEEAVAKAMMGKSYEIAGEFQAYDFKDAKTHLNWAYKNNATGKWNRLMGDSNADKNLNPFGWKEVDIKPNNPKAEKWYMVKLSGAADAADAAGKFGWAMVSSDLKTVKKIASVKGDASFEYLSVSIKASMADDKITFSK